MTIARNHFAAITLLFLLGADVNPTTRPAIHVPHEQLKSLTWQLAVPTATFTDKTVFESIDLLHSLTIHHLEITPGQAISVDMPGVVVGQMMPQAATDALLAKLKSVHMDIVSYGPVDVGSDDASARAVFAFAKQFKAKDVVATDPARSLDSLHKLAAEFGINLVTVEGMKLLQGHLTQIRITQVDPAMIAELKGQGFKGVIAIACKPGGGENEINQLINTVNALSDALGSTNH